MNGLLYLAMMRFTFPMAKCRRALMCVSFVLLTFPTFSQVLIWSDEFDVDGALDSTKWHHQTQLPNGVSWWNGELQHYTDRLDNSYVDDGKLYIVAKKETFSDQGQTMQYTSARLNSKFAFTYGRVEVKAKLPTGAGTWPAIWMLGKNINEIGAFWAEDHGTVGWPACGEIDIMEHWGTNQDYVQSAVHTPSSFGATVNKGGLLATDVSNVFHVYAVDWLEDRLEFSIDGNLFYTYAPSEFNSDTWPFDADQYLLMNVAIVGTIDPAFTESPMVVDYVRVYQGGTTTSVSTIDLLEDVQVYPNPSGGSLQLSVGNPVMPFSVVVEDLSGRVIYRSGSTFDQVLNIELEASPGLYVLSLFTDSGQTASRLITIE